MPETFAHHYCGNSPLVKLSNNAPQVVGERLGATVASGIFRLFVKGVLTLSLMAASWPSASWAQPEVEPIRLGWQTTWATQGQLVMALRHTNIPELAGVRLNFVGFAYGAPLNRAALANEVDLLLTADQPALVLLSQDVRFRIVARLMYNRTCLYSPRTTDLPSLLSLQGRRIAGPIGAAAERVALQSLSGAGVDISRLQVVNLDMSQQAALLLHARPGRPWAGVDALFGFDPLVATFEEQGLVSLLHCGRVTAVVVSREDFIQRREADLVRFLGALRLAWATFAAEPQRLNRIFAAVSGLDVSDGALNRSSAEEPNRFASSARAMRLELNQEDLQGLAVTRSFLQERGLLRLTVDLDRQIDLAPLLRSAAIADWDKLAGHVRFIGDGK